MRIIQRLFMLCDYSYIREDLCEEGSDLRLYRKCCHAGTQCPPVTTPSHSVICIVTHQKKKIINGFSTQTLVVVIFGVSKWIIPRIHPLGCITQPWQLRLTPTLHLKKNPKNNEIQRGVDFLFCKSNGRLWLQTIVALILILRTFCSQKSAQC